MSRGTQQPPFPVEVAKELIRLITDSRKVAALRLMPPMQVVAPIALHEIMLSAIYKCAEALQDGMPFLIKRDKQWR